MFTSVKAAGLKNDLSSTQCSASVANKAIGYGGLMLQRLLTSLVWLLVAAGIGLQAATTATATVSFTISSINSISVSGSPASLNISSATAGSQPSNAVDASTTYSVTTNNSNKSIIVSSASNFPTNTTLNIGLQAPSGATSTPQNVSTVSSTLVTGITQLVASGLTITYTFTATVAAAQATSAIVVTYTIQ